MRKSLFLAGVATLLLVAPMAMAAQSSMKAQSGSGKSASITAGHGTKSVSMSSGHGTQSANFTAHRTTGTVKSVDANAGTLTLSNGTRYYLPASQKGSELKSGEKVRIAWMMKSGKHEASSVTAVK